MALLIEHGRKRHAPADGQLVRCADGRPVTSRRYDHLWARIGRHLPWVAAQGISSHWLRRILLTWVEGRGLRLRRRPRLRRPRRRRQRDRSHAYLSAGTWIRPCRRRPGIRDRSAGRCLV